VDIRGESATGAELVATGRIWPPRDGAAVEIDIRLRNLRTDALFRDSLPENRRSVYRTIFSETQYDRLREDGFLLSSSDREELVRERIEVQASVDAMDQDETASPVEIELLRERLAAIDRRLALPVFDLGGTGTLDIAIRREQGDESRYEETIVVDIPDAGLVVDRFPYPAMADRLRLTIADGTASIDRSALRGLHGGSGSIEGRVRYGRNDYVPDIRISAGDVPIDGLLVQALPGRASFEERAAAEVLGEQADGGFSVHRFLRRMNLVGTASCEAHIFASERDSTDFAVDVRFDDVAAHPIGAIGISDADLLRLRIGVPGSEPALLTDLSGAFRVTDDRLDMPLLNGRVASDGGQFEGTVFVSYPQVEGRSGRVTESIAIDLRGESIAVGQRLERVLDAADASRASVVALLRDRFNPDGRIDARLTLSGGGDDLRYAVHATGIERLAFDAFGGRAEVVGSTGAVEAVPGRINLEQIEGQLRFDGALAGQLRVDGAYSLDAIGAPPGQTLRLVGSVRDALFESQLPEAVVAQFSPALGARLEQLELAGLFDTDFTVRSGTDPGLEAELRPRSVSIARGGATAQFDEASGSIGVSDGGGPIDLRFESDDLQAAVVGDWTRSLEEPFGLDVQVSGSAASLHEGVNAILPDAVVELMGATEIASGRAVSVSDARLRIRPDRSRFEGVVGFEALDLRIGLPVTDLLGRAVVQAELARDSEPRIEIDIIGERGELAGAGVTDIAARIETGAAFRNEENGRANDAPGTVYVPSVGATLAGGRLAATGVIAPDPRGGYAGGRWQADGELSGVDFGMLLADLARDPERAARAPENRGLLDANLSLTGRIGDVESQRGRTLLRVQPAPGADGTEVLRLPGLIEFVKLSSLQAPVSEPIDFAYAEAFIEGRVVHLHDLSAESKSVSIRGSGTMTLPDLGLDLTFTTVVLRDISLITEIVERVRNELVTARISGTLYDPQVEVEQLSATRKLIDAIIRGDETPPAPPPAPSTPPQSPPEE
jgi:hypothetical protein